MGDGSGICKDMVVSEHSPTQPKSKRPYRKKLTGNSTPQCNPIYKGGGRGKGRRGKGRGVANKGHDGELPDLAILSPKRAVPKPSILFTPPETRSRGSTLKLPSTRSSNTPRILFDQSIVAEAREWTRRPGKEPAIDDTSSSGVLETDDVLQSLQVVQTGRSNFVKIAFINMQWGGELLETPCGTAFGRVLQTIKRAADKDERLLCDFGADFGIQEVFKKDCHFMGTPLEGDDGFETPILNIASEHQVNLIVSTPIPLPAAIAHPVLELKSRPSFKVGVIFVSASIDRQVLI